MSQTPPASTAPTPKPTPWPDSFFVGYLSFSILAKDNLLGGLLVLDKRGFPRDFRFCTATQPNPLQAKLYGQSLEACLLESVTTELIRDLKAEPALILTNHNYQFPKEIAPFPIFWASIISGVVDSMEPMGEVALPFSMELLATSLNFKIEEPFNRVDEALGMLRSREQSKNIETKTMILRPELLHPEVNVKDLPIDESQMVLEAVDDLLPFVEGQEINLPSRVNQGQTLTPKPSLSQLRLLQPTVKTQSHQIPMERPQTSRNINHKLDLNIQRVKALPEHFPVYFPLPEAPLPLDTAPIFKSILKVYPLLRKSEIALWKFYPWLPLNLVEKSLMINRQLHVLYTFSSEAPLWYSRVYFVDRNSRSPKFVEWKKKLSLHGG